MDAIRFRRKPMNCKNEKDAQLQFGDRELSVFRETHLQEERLK
jgi:hypothetical protein|tara:strand:+ start:322 stop:450 length:129 start_codon:yes stop_codon:yes gene_type:complete